MSTTPPPPPPPPPAQPPAAPPPPPPSAPPPPPGMPAGGPAPQNGMGVAALVLSILGIVGCIPFLGSILGIIFGVIGMRNAREGRANNGGMAKAGLIIGIIGLVLAVIGTILYIILIAVAVTQDQTNTDNIRDLNSLMSDLNSMTAQ